MSGKSGSPGGHHYRTPSNMSVLTDESASIMSMRATSNMNMSMRNLSSMSSQRWSEECGLTGSHAATLDRLFAWEKKLYLEVKVRLIPGPVEYSFESAFLVKEVWTASSVVELTLRWNVWVFV
jgi:hypothetical protein